MCVCVMVAEAQQQVKAHPLYLAKMMFLRLVLEGSLGGAILLAKVASHLISSTLRFGGKELHCVC